jgi:hypothetical protein
MKLPPMKFRISNFLEDSGAASRCPEHYSPLDQTLKNRLPKPAPAGSLHDSIMCAVRGAPRPAAGEERAGWPRWIPVSSLALLALLAVFVAIRLATRPDVRVQPAGSQTLAAAGSALELGGSLMRQAPAAAMSPLSDEMQKLDRDLEDTERFLLATLP